MKRRNYRVRSVTVEMPSIISDGLDDASVKYKISKSDIVRSVLYDFLVSSGVIHDNKDLNRPDDKYIECVGRPSVLLTIR